MRKIERWGELRPRLRSDRGTWEILVPVALSGTGKRARVNFPTEGEAEKWLSERSLEAASGRIVALSAREPGGVTVAELVRLYRAEKERVLAKGSFAILTKRLRRFEAAFSGRAAGAVSGFEAKRWLGGLSGAQRSRYGVFSEVRGLYRWACRYRLLSGNPFEEMEPERKGRSAKAIFTPEQLRAVLAMELPPWFRAWVVLGAFAGLRTVEIERLDWSAVHRREKRVFVGADVVKQSVHELRPRYVDLLPAVNPASRSGSSGAALEIEIPDRSEMFPGKLAADTDAEAAEKDPTKLPKPAGLIPAIHDATIESITVPLPSATSGEGKVYRNDSGVALLVPGGLGRRGGYLDPLGYAGSDGRVWYRLARDGTTNSFYPLDFEKELFMLHINDQMLRAGTAFTLEFKLALRLFNATTRAQYLLRIDVGSAPGQTTPAPTGENLEDVTWASDPLLSQRIILSGLKMTHNFGCAIRRDINGVLHSDRMSYGNWTAASVVPPSASFVIRARLVEFDTENSVKGAKGTVFFALTEAKADIS